MAIGNIEKLAAKASVSVMTAAGGISMRSKRMFSRIGSRNETA